jgi:hypothetical protein
MADTFGALELPAQIPTASDTVTDPALDVIGEFSAAVLNFYAGDAWAWAAVAVDSTPFVKTVNTHNPEDVEFNSRDLPALFLWRSRGITERLADDWLIARDNVTLLWVPRPEAQKKRARRSPIFNAFEKFLAPAFENGRDPAWIKAGDTDPFAASRGSSFLDWAGLFRAPTEQPIQVTNTKLVIQMEGSEPRTYDAVTLQMELAERLVRDPAVHSEAPTSVQFDIDIDGLIVDSSIDGR